MEFILTRVTKPIYKENYKLETHPCQGRMLKVLKNK